MGNYPYKKMVVIGTTGSGKSTLARQLAEKLGLVFIELDELNWGPNWTTAGHELLKTRVDEATRAPGWVVAGNYSVTRPIIWSRAEAVIWLDYSLPIVFWRLTFRTFKRSISREALWNGNREIFWWHLKIWSDKSLFHWLFKTFWRRKREYPHLIVQSEYAHLKTIHHNSPKQTTDWFASL